MEGRAAVDRDLDDGGSGGLPVWLLGLIPLLLIALAVGAFAVLAEAGRAEHREQRDRQRDQRQRHQPQQPDGTPRDPARPAGGAARLHQPTSKKPCQPSSVNSDWWAWNMKRPAVGKRHSRIPRWPWHSITVSVSSEGVSAVPVGM